MRNNLTALDIWITREGEPFGPYDVDRARFGMQEGRLLPDDHAFHEGLSGWTPLAEVLAALPESPVPNRPWCPRCKDYTEVIFVSKKAIERHREGSSWYECKTCDSVAINPFDDLSGAKLWAWFFLIPIGLALLVLVLKVIGFSLVYDIIIEISPGALVLVAVFLMTFFVISAYLMYRYCKWKSWDKTQR